LALSSKLSAKIPRCNGPSKDLSLALFVCPRSFVEGFDPQKKFFFLTAPS